MTQDTVYLDTEKPPTNYVVEGVPDDDQPRGFVRLAKGAIINGVFGRVDDDETKNRWYVKPGGDLVLPSVTDALQRTHSEGFLKNYFLSLPGKGVVEDFETLVELMKNEGPEAVEKYVTKKAHFLSEIKARIGSYQHAVLESLLLDMEIPEIPEDLVGVQVDGERADKVWFDGISDGLLKFFADHPKAVVEMAEATVAHPENGHAGTLDLIIYFPDGIVLNVAGEGEPPRLVRFFRLLIDLKNGKWLDKKMRAQLAAYRNSTEVWLDNIGTTMEMPEVDGAAILHLRKTYKHGYKLIYVDSGPEQYDYYLDCLNLIKKYEAQPDKLGTVIYPPKADGLQPLPMLEDVDVPNFWRCRKPLDEVGVETLDEIAQFTPSELTAIKGIGPSTIDAIQNAFDQYGIAFTKQEQGVA